MKHSIGALLLVCVGITTSPAFAARNAAEIRLQEKQNKEAAARRKADQAPTKSSFLPPKQGNSAPVAVSLNLQQKA